MSEPAWRAHAQLAANGWTKNHLDNAVRRGRVQVPMRGVFLPTDLHADLWQMCGAALSTQHPLAAISRRTAAVAQEFAWLPDEWRHAPYICVDAPRDDLTRSARRGLDRRLSALPDEDVILWHGLRMTTDARTGVDIARYEPRDVAIPVLDWLLTEQRCSRDDFLAVIDRMVRVPHVRRARQFVDLAREGVASPRETHTRLRMLDAGLPDPDVNLEIDRDGIVLAQGDLGYWRWLIWIEYDGRDIHDLRRFFGDDQSKDRWLARRGWEIFRLTNRDHYSPAIFHRELRSAITEAPARIAAMSPSRSAEVAAARIALGMDPAQRRS